MGQSSKERERAVVAQQGEGESGWETAMLAGERERVAGGATERGGVWL